MKICRNCGAMMDDDSLYCPECGMRQEEQTSYGQEQAPYGQENWTPYRKKGGGAVVVGVFLLIGVLIVGGIGFGIYRLTHPQRNVVSQYETEDRESSSQTEEYDDGESSDNDLMGGNEDYDSGIQSRDYKEDSEDSESYQSPDIDTAEPDYIIPYSNQRLLGDSDIAGLSLREINYAKNEIYARHGRKFDSQELQNYFNSKSWYYGTIEPENFSESMLSDVEKKNAEYLSNVEFSISANGYQLDQ